ncbi:UNVERIFIED_CONTAM: Deoxynucleotidyltransferase terminal-interacting protein 2 [Siphonaria sp. JEL0065]|nr:Deoxynucleotidyltransferase terminal-interacting protein 2 [Siphonaria sp. JEL0065]
MAKSKSNRNTPTRASAKQKISADPVKASPPATSTPAPVPSTLASSPEQPPSSPPQQEKEPESVFSFSNIDSFSDQYLDSLLNKATQVLMERSETLKQQEAEKKASEQQQQAEDGTVFLEPKKEKKEELKPSLLKTVNLDPNLKSISSSNSYLVESSTRGAVRLNPSKFEIVETTRSLTGGSSELVTKGLGRGDSKGLLDRIVVTKTVNQVAPELDLDEKKKKKLVVETSGPKWFDMPAPDLTDKLKLEVQIIKARNVLDPKHHYKRLDTNAPAYPKFFQMGTVIEGAADFHNSRIAKRDRKQGLVEEVMADAKTKKYLKRKFGEIKEKNQAMAKRPMSKKKRTGPAAKGPTRK